jgi:hypothetical protein
MRDTSWLALRMPQIGNLIAIRVSRNAHRSSITVDHDRRLNGRQRRGVTSATIETRVLLGLYVD